MRPNHLNVTPQIIHFKDTHIVISPDILSSTDYLSRTAIKIACKRGIDIIWDAGNVRCRKRDRTIVAVKARSCFIENSLRSGIISLTEKTEINHSMVDVTYCVFNYQTIIIQRIHQP